VFRFDILAVSSVEADEISVEELITVQSSGDDIFCEQ